MIRALLLWLALALPAAAQDLPDWQHTSINDFAGLLTAEDTQVLDQALIALHGETGVQGTVVTLTDRARYGGGDGLEPFATRLFNHWGVGDATRNDGFMVLLLRDDREVRVELGAGYPPAADAIAAEIVQRRMLPDLRAGDYSHALREGTLDVIQRIARPQAAGQALQAPTPMGGLTGWLLPVAVFGVIGFVGVQMARSLIRQMRGGRPAPCPQCGGSGLIAQAAAPDAPPGTTVFGRCPSCGWVGPLPSPDRGGAWHRTGGGGGSGGFGGGHSSGGGASGRW